MTPKHQQLIETTLRQVQARAQVLQRVLGPSDHAERGEALLDEESQMEVLRASRLGQKLRWIAEYVEGYPAAVEPERRISLGQPDHLRGGMRKEIFLVCSVVYGSAHEGGQWAYPRRCQHTDLGRLLHAALLQFYRQYLPKEQLMSVAQAAKMIGIARQTLHEWMDQGRIHWIYESERDLVWLDHDEVQKWWHTYPGIG